MAKYVVGRMNVGFGDYVYTINRVDGSELIPVQPIRYYKTKKRAELRIKHLLARK